MKNERVKSESFHFSLFHDFYFDDFFAWGAVSLAGHVDGCVGLEGQDAQFQVGGACGQSP